VKIENGKSWMEDPQWEIEKMLKGICFLDQKSATNILLIRISHGKKKALVFSAGHIRCGRLWDFYRGRRDRKPQHRSCDPAAPE
jgi:hypothetical protein